MTNIAICPFFETIVKACFKAICCDLCSKWIRIKWNNVKDLDCENLKRKVGIWYCKTCVQAVLRFCSKINPNTINVDNASIDPNLKNLLCQSNHLSEKESNDNLNIHKPKKLESVFVEVILPKKSNSMYIHTNIWTYAYRYLNPLLHNSFKETNKTNVLLGDFKIYLLNFDKSEHVCTFLNDLASNPLPPQILLPTRISNKSKALIDHIFAIYQLHWSKLQCLVYRIIFQNFL